MHTYTFTYSVLHIPTGEIQQIGIEFRAFEPEDAELEFLRQLNRWNADTSGRRKLWKYWY
jgi:hypothetical protein